LRKQVNVLHIIYHEVLAVDALPNFILLKESNVGSITAQHNAKFRQSSTLEKDLSFQFDHTVVSTANEVQVHILEEILI
jgi:hypothetical protein